MSFFGLENKRKTPPENTKSMALPNPGMDAVPFTPLTAEFLDDIIENIESLSSGTGIGDGSITADKLDFATLRKVLYTGPSATSGSVTMSESIMNFSSVEIGTSRGAVFCHGFLLRGLVLLSVPRGLSSCSFLWKESAAFFPKSLLARSGRFICRSSRMMF